MIETADIVAARYGISREAQDRYAAQSQQRAEAAQAAGRYREEIIPVTTVMAVTDRATGAVSEREVTVDRDTATAPARPTRCCRLAGARGRPVRHRRQCLAAVRRRGRLRADGSGRGPPRRHRAAGRLPGPGHRRLRARRDGHRPRPCRAKTAGAAWLEVDDIDLWELNEAFASQVLYCQQRLGIPMERLNVNGGAIALGHPFGVTGARLAGHVLLEGRRRGARYAVVTMRGRRHGPPDCSKCRAHPERFALPSRGAATDRKETHRATRSLKAPLRTGRRDPPALRAPLSAATDRHSASVLNYTGAWRHG